MRSDLFLPFLVIEAKELINGIVIDVELGKIEVVGPDAVTFMNRLYVNAWNSLAVGRCRYGVLLREDGFILDDGVVARIAEECFHITTTTGGQGNPPLCFVICIFPCSWAIACLLYRARNHQMIKPSATSVPMMPTIANPPGRLLSNSTCSSRSRSLRSGGGGTLLGRAILHLTS